jgi:hypothetical protein
MNGIQKAKEECFMEAVLTGGELGTCPPLLFVEGIASKSVTWGAFCGRI